VSRSWKKPFVTISKAWDKFKQRAFRHRIKRACRDAEINFDPDKDYDELHLTNKKLGEYGTRMGFNVPPAEGDTTWWHDEYKKLSRK
jgi:hypothetical protein